jgi:quinol monooxygenase YgiN
MSMVAQYARFVAKKGMGGAVRDALELAAETAATEVGTVVYIVHVALDDPDTVWMYELYASLEAQQLHSSSEATAQLRATVADLVGEPIVVLKGEPVRVLGLTTN